MLNAITFYVVLNVIHSMGKLRNYIRTSKPTQTTTNEWYTTAIEKSAPLDKTNLKLNFSNGKAKANEKRMLTYVNVLISISSTFHLSFSFYKQNHKKKIEISIHTYEHEKCKRQWDSSSANAIAEAAINNMSSP